MICANAIFLLFLFCLADLDILCSGLFSHHVKFYSFMFMYKISTPMVCVNDISMGGGVGSGGYFPIKIAGVIVTPKICGLVLLRVQ